MKYKLHVKGMTCSHCENKVKEALIKIQKIIAVEANAGKDIVIIETSKKISEGTLKKTIKKAGYEFSSQKIYNKSFYENIKEYMWLIPLVLLLVLGRKYVPNINFENKKDLAVSLIIIYALLNSLHCASMCGGLIVTRLMISKEKTNKTKEVINYVIGRLISYTSIGVLLGAFGSIITINKVFQGFVSLFAGILMVLLALKSIGLIKLPTIKPNIKLPKGKSSFIIGLFNGLMPCGALYVMHLYALASGSPITGGIIMLIFSIFTSISLISVAFMTSKLKLNNKIIRVISFGIIMFLGIQFIFQGYTGIKVETSDVLEQIQIIETEEYQELTITIKGGYSFDLEEIQVGIPLKINFKVVYYSGCSNPFYIVTPDNKRIKIDVTEDKSSITILPTKTGKLRVICWMNMIENNINVVE